MLFPFIFGIDKDIINIRYHKNIELLYQNLVDVALKRDWGVCQAKKYHIVLEIAIASFESCFPFITLSDLYLIIDIGYIKLDETSSPT